MIKLRLILLVTAIFVKNEVTACGCQPMPACAAMRGLREFGSFPFPNHNARNAAIETVKERFGKYALEPYSDLQLGKTVFRWFWKSNFGHEKIGKELADKIVQKNYKVLMQLKFTDIWKKAYAAAKRGLENSSNGDEYLEFVNDNLKTQLSLFEKDVLDFGQGILNRELPGTELKTTYIFKFRKAILDLVLFKNEKYWLPEEIPLEITGTPVRNQRNKEFSNNMPESWMNKLLALQGNIPGFENLALPNKNSESRSLRGPAQVSRDSVNEDIRPLSSSFNPFENLVWSEVPILSHQEAKKNKIKNNKRG